MSADLSITKLLRRRQALEAIGDDTRYTGAEHTLGNRPASDARLIVAALTTLNCGPGAQANRRLAEARLIEAGYLPAESEL